MRRMLVRNFLKLAWKSLCYRRGAVAITVAAIAVSVFTLLSVEHLRQTAKQSFNSTVSNVDLIVGPRTGDINLLLSTVFRIGHPSQNMSWGSYQSIVKHPNVSWTIPISLGDSHRGFRVVGTEHQFFTHFQYGRSRYLDFAAGGAFTDIYDVVLGANVARELDYSLSKKLIIAHGLGHTSFQKHDAYPFQVSGILKPTGTPVDNALYVSLKGLESMHQSPSRLKPKSTSAQLQPTSISATMVGLTSKLATFKVQRELNSSPREPLTAILPGVTLTQLWQMSRGVESVLTLMAALILVASLLGLSAIMIATLRERTHEFSVLRTLGASSLYIFTLIQLETLLISVLGIIVGTGVFVSSILLFADGLATTYGIDIGLHQISMSHGIVVGYVLAGAFSAGLLPALAGFIKSQKTAG